MKMLPIDEVTSKDQARQLAVDWQIWQANESMSYGQLDDWHSYFQSLAEKFNLGEEFHENGII